jgi:serine/threonine-protein kinase
MGNAFGSADDVTYSFIPDDPGRVLDTLARSVGPMPRVLLPDTDAGPEQPVVKPSSGEMPSPSERSSRVQLLGEIARGGMGAVLKARDPDLGRDVAVKVLLEAHREKPDLIRRFVEEAQIGGQLQHPGIVPVYELGTFGDSRPYFTMKLVKGQTLAALLGSRQDLADGVAKFLGIFEQVAQTVAYAHARGVIHRDLKPSNVMVGSFGEVQVMDWGLAKVLSRGGATDDAPAGMVGDQETVISTSRNAPDSDLSQAGSVLGTPSYMAPEQARGEIERVDERADVFALGSILCEVLTGRPAFVGRSSGEIQRKAAVGDVADALARLDACGADAELIALARDCLAPEADDRPENASAVDGRVNGYLAGVQDRLRSAERQAAVSEATAVKERKRRKLQLGLAASLVGLMVLLGGGYAWNERQKAARVSRIARAVDDALADAARFRGEALAASPEDSGKWAEAASAIERAEALLAQGEAHTALKERVSALLNQVESERALALEKARRKLVDRALLAELESIRGDRAIHDNLLRANNEYAAAFRKAGLDLEAVDPTEAGRRIASRFEPSELAAYLDDWASISRRADRTGVGRWRRLVETARAADADPWRDALRAVVGSKEGVAFLKLSELADDTRALEAQPAASLVLLARELGVVGTPEARERARQVLREATALHPGDFWAHFELGRGGSPGKSDFSRPEESIVHLTAASAIRPGSASTRFFLGEVLNSQSRNDEAIVQFRESLRLNRDSSWAQLSLYETLRGQGKLAEEEATCRKAARLRPDDAWAHADLAGTLKASEKYEDAIVEFREAIRLKPDMLLAQVELGGTYYRLNRLAEAVAPWREAVRLNPDDPVMHLNLALALARSGAKSEQIVAEYREAIRLQPDSADNHEMLGSALFRSAKVDEAIVELLEAIRLRPNYVQAYRDLDLALARKEKSDEVIACYEKVVELDPKSARSHLYLGIELENNGQLDEAIGCFEKAIELDPKNVYSYNNLGNVLRLEGRLDEAVACFETAVKLDPNSEYATDGLRRTAALAASRDKFAAFQNDRYTPSTNEERLGLIEWCRIKRFHRAASRLSTDAFAADPKLLDDLKASHRYNAACSAALAATGRGEDAAGLDDQERASLRTQALDWLRVDLVSRIRQLDDAKVDRAAARKALLHWRRDPDLAGLREADALARLPEAARAPWQALWREVTETLLKPEGPRPGDAGDP